MLSYRKLAMRVLGRPLHTGGGIDSPRPASQRAAAFVLTAALLTGAAFPAFAGTYYIEEGDITISAGTVAGTNKVEQGGTLKSENDKDTVITNQKTDTASSNTVTIDAGKDKVEVTLKDVNIDASSRKEAAMSVTGSGNTTIKLDGDNHLTGGNGSSGIGSSGIGSSGIGSSGIDSIGSLTIYGGENDSLTAKGGSGADGYGGDGIRSGGVVTISGNTVNAAGATAAKSAATASAASTVSPSPAVRSKPLAVTAAPAATASPAAAASPSPTVRSLPPEAIARAVMAPAATASAATAASPFPAVRSKPLAATAKTATAATASAAATSICRAASS